MCVCTYPHTGVCVPHAENLLSLNSYPSGLVSLFEFFAFFPLYSFSHFIFASNFQNFPFSNTFELFDYLFSSFIAFLS